MTPQVIAKDIMVTRLITLTPDMDVYEAIDLMLKHRISGAPVVDDEGRLVGIFSEKDSMGVLIEAAVNNLPTANVASFMRTDVKSVDDQIDLLSLANIFRNSSYRRLPVVRDGKLIGQISRRDLLAAASDLLKPKAIKGPSFLFVSNIADRKDAPIA